MDDITKRKPSWVGLFNPLVLNPPLDPEAGGLTVFEFALLAAVVTSAWTELGDKSPACHHKYIRTFPKIESCGDSRCEAESAHHPMRCLRSSICLQPS